MRFRTSPATSPRSTRNQQRKLTWMIFALGLVVIGIWKAADPRTWSFVNKPEAVPKAKSSNTSKTPPVVEEVPLQPGEFRLPADPAAPPPQRDKASPAADESSAGGFAPELLATIRDEMLGVRSSEFEAYRTMLARAKKTPLRALEGMAAREVSYAELINDLSKYRGQVVTLEGEFRRVVRLEGDGPEGIGTTYEGWLFTRSAGSRLPICVRFVELPAGMPVGDKIVEKVRVTGFVFKRYSYPSAAGVSTAPMVLARKPRWFPPKTAQSGPESSVTLILSAVTFLALAFGFVAWRYTTIRPPRATEALPGSEPVTESFAALKDYEPLDLTAAIRQMEAERDDETQDTVPDA